MVTVMHSHPLPKPRQEFTHPFSFEKLSPSDFERKDSRTRSLGYYLAPPSGGWEPRPSPGPRYDLIGLSQAYYSPGSSRIR